MNKSEFISKLKDINGLVCLCQFGSYGTKFWIRDRSDIDVIAIMGPNVKYIDTLDIEDIIEELLKNYYGYDNIHITFVLFNEFSSKYARMAIDSSIQYIVDENGWFDFQHYVLKYIRNNEQFERTLKIDEQYSYFGGIVDESLL